MKVTPVEILILVNAIQPEKALAAILVTVLGIVVIFVNAEQFLKASAAILVTPLVGIFITWVKLVRPVNPDKVAGVPVVVYVNPPSLVVQVNPDHPPLSTIELKTNVKFRIYIFAKGGIVKLGLSEFTLVVTYKFAVDGTSVNTSVPIVIDDVEKMYTLFNAVQP